MTIAENTEIKKELIKSYRKQRGLTPFERVICNAALIAGITFFSTLSIDFPPHAQNLWAAFIAGSIALLTQLKTITDMTADQKPRRPLGMLI